MARKKTEVAIKEPDQIEIVPDGDFAGMRVEDVMRALVDDVHDVLGGTSIEVAGATLDMAMGEFLEVAQHQLGDKDAKIFAIRFCESALPYATLPVSIGETYGHARRIIGGRK